MKVVAGWAGAILGITLMAGAWHVLSPRHTPAGQPSLTRLSVDSLERLEQAFNAEKQKTRILVMLSPT